MSACAQQCVFVVHCVDTEGPLHESLAATFERLYSLFGIDLEPDRRTLAELQAGRIDLGGKEEAVRRTFAPHLLAYNDTWDKIDTMLCDALSPAFRDKLPDTDGKGWVYTWHCVDHVGYDGNPRRRDLGYHNVFDHYVEMLRETGSSQDGLEFHFHPHPFSKQAHKQATHWWAVSDSLHQVLSRRIIDRQWFPAVNRPGFHVTRPDSHWFLEQFIPFDYANQAMADGGGAGEGGRFGDWRRAPANWQPYHPAHDDYQVPGDCWRWIARCLNIGTRHSLLVEGDVRQAFEEAREGRPVVLAVTNHDFRDLRVDVEYVRDLLARVAPAYPGVAFRYASAVEAMRLALDLDPLPPCELDVDLEALPNGAHRLTVGSAQPTFGPQPYLAMKTTAGQYHHDNFDFETPRQRWTYTFDSHTFPLAALAGVGVAAANDHGAVTVVNLDPETKQPTRRYLNGEEPA